ncbi:hypothetical protein UYSO10_1635 [Kosakonia radicincitans]|nr:hypothetical protein UYSO10_1635 [Kosakonia radicincitans]
MGKFPTDTQGENYGIPGSTGHSHGQEGHIDIYHCGES